MGKLITKEHAVVDGVRNVGEIKELKNAGDAFIIGITSPQSIRFLRLRKRKREARLKNSMRLWLFMFFRNKRIIRLELCQNYDL